MSGRTQDTSVAFISTFNFEYRAYFECSNLIDQTDLVTVPTTLAFSHIL